jgi:hypothetical protein
LSYEELYRFAYRIVLKKRGEELYQRVKSFEYDWLSTTVRDKIHHALPASLLAKPDGGRSGTSMNERRTAGERFLKTVKDAWQDHQLCMAMLADVLMYMVRQIRNVQTNTNVNKVQGTCLLPGQSSAIDIHYCVGPISLPDSEFRYR